MENLNEPVPGSEEDLRASNQLLKLKLELEHGAMSGTSDDLDPALENQWLNHIYNFEKKYKEAGMVKIYDLLGRPEFKPADKLTDKELPEEIAWLLGKMKASNIALDFICKYDDRLIYRFITEEFFNHETIDFSDMGGISGFIYEEFHPNHEDDLRKLARNFCQCLFGGTSDEHFITKWSDFQKHYLANELSFKGTSYTRDEICDIIQLFLDANPIREVRELRIDSFKIDESITSAGVELTLAYTTRDDENNRTSTIGKGYVKYVNSRGFWEINDFGFPGLGM